MPALKMSRLLGCWTLVLLSIAPVWAQGPQNPGLVYLQTIPVPGWKATGTPGNANVDLMGYNPVTRIMYLADRTNHGVDVIDTHTNSVVGLIPVPGIGSCTGCPNVPLVAIDLQQLVVSDGLSSVYVWDLRAPQPSQPDQYTFPTTMGTNTDALEYDPINQTIYVVTDNPPEYLIGISLPLKKVVSQTPLPVSADLIKFNPIDGKIYIAAEDAEGGNAGAGVYAYDPETDAVRLVSRIGPPCPGHGIDIDPISNIAVVGCFGGVGDNGDIAVDLSNGALLTTFTDVGGTDTVVFNPNNRRFYAAAGLNTATTSGCPKGTGPFTPILGVMNASGPPRDRVRLDGVVCTGPGHIAGVDPITNFVYVPVSQYPADPNSSTTGQNGVLVFWDSSPLAQAAVTEAEAKLAPLGGNAASATVDMTLHRRRMSVRSLLTGVTGHIAWLVIPTTVGNELVPCTLKTSTGGIGCSGDLVGDPLVGSIVTLSVDSIAVARGLITRSPRDVR